MHETGCSGPVHWDDPEGWDGEGGGREVQDGGHMYTCGWFKLMYGESHYNIVINLQLNKLKKKPNALRARPPWCQRAPPAPHAGEPAVWGSGLSLLWENNSMTFLQFVGQPCWGVVGFDCIMSPLLLPLSLWFRHVFSCRKSVLVGSSLCHWQLFCRQLWLCVLVRGAELGGFSALPPLSSKRWAWRTWGTCLLVSS